MNTKCKHIKLNFPNSLFGKCMLCEKLGATAAIQGCITLYFCRECFAGRYNEAETLWRNRAEQSGKDRSES